MKKIASILVIFILAFHVSAQAESRIFAVKHLSAAELLPKVQALLSKDGRAALDEGANSLIVTDSPPVIAEIDRLLKDLDAPRAMVTLRVQSLSTSILENTGVRIDWQRIDGNWRLGDLSESAKGDRTYEAQGKSLIVHASGDAAERLYRVRAGETAQVSLGPRVRGDRVKAGVFLGQPFVKELEAASVQAVLLITPAVSEKNVFLTVVPAVLVFKKGKASVHALDTLKVTAKCGVSGQAVLSTNDANGPALLTGLLSGLEGPTGEAGGGFSLLLRVNVE